MKTITIQHTEKTSFEFYYSSIIEKTVCLKEIKLGSIRSIRDRKLYTAKDGKRFFKYHGTNITVNV